MPVDPSVLLKYDARPPPPKPRREGLCAVLVAAIGTPVLVLLAWAADGNAALVRVFMVLTLLAVAGATLALLYLGYQKGGILGALMEHDHPLGSELTPDESPSWMRFAALWLVLLACILTAVLVLRTPEADMTGVFGGRARHVVPGS